MRENIGIFKAKIKDKNEWIEGFYTQIIFSQDCFENSIVLNGHFIISKDEWWAEIDPETLCECSGLRDDNKQLIFEHDKLKDNKGQVGTVFYANGRYAVNWCGVDGEYFVDTCFYGKIIGNKFSEVEE